MDAMTRDSDETHQHRLVTSRRMRVPCRKQRTTRPISRSSHSRHPIEGAITGIVSAVGTKF